MAVQRIDIKTRAFAVFFHHIVKSRVTFHRRHGVNPSQPIKFVPKIRIKDFAVGDRFARPQRIRPGRRFPFYGKINVKHFACRFFFQIRNCLIDCIYLSNNRVGKNFHLIKISVDLRGHRFFSALKNIRVNNICYRHILSSHKKSPRKLVPRAWLLKQT